MFMIYELDGALPKLSDFFEKRGKQKREVGEGSDLENLTKVRDREKQSSIMRSLIEVVQQFSETRGKSKV